VYIATKTMASKVEGFWGQLHASLKELNTDYIDVYQFHNPAFVPRPGGEDGMYDAMMEAKRQGKIRYIGITNHRLGIAEEAVASGLYDTLQFPFSLLSGEPDMALLELCRQYDIGFVAMKALSGGLITDVRPTFAFLRQLPEVVPIWGVQHMHELEQLLALDADPPALDDEMRAQIERDRTALSGDFCRGCGYCLPCPADIEINMAARIYYLITRSPYKKFITDAYQKKMARAEDCIHCGACKSRCPYGLDTPALVQKHYKLYKGFVRAHADEVTAGDGGANQGGGFLWH